MAENPMSSEAPQQHPGVGFLDDKGVPTSQMISEQTNLSEQKRRNQLAQTRPAQKSLAEAVKLDPTSGQTSRRPHCPDGRSKSRNPSLASTQPTTSTDENRQPLNFEEIVSMAIPLFMPPEVGKKTRKKGKRTSKAHSEYNTASPQAIWEEIGPSVDAYTKARYEETRKPGESIDETAKNMTISCAKILQLMGATSNEADEFQKNTAAVFAMRLHQIIEPKSLPCTTLLPNSTESASQTGESRKGGSKNAKAGSSLKEGLKILESSKPPTSGNSVCRQKFQPNPHNQELPDLSMKAVEVLVDQYGHDPRWSRSIVTRAAWAAEDLLQTLIRVENDVEKK